MSDEKDAAVEAYADSRTDAQLAESMANESDLLLGKLAGIAEVQKDLKCGGVKEATGETNGTCRVYNAALNEFDSRLKNNTPAR